MTESKKVFVAGAGGQTGCAVIRHLAKHGENFEINAGVNADDSKSQGERVLSIARSARIVSMDRDDPESMAKNLEGVSDLFIIPTSTDAKMRHGRNYIKAAKLAGVKFVCLLSMIGAEQRQYLFAEEFSYLEETLKREKVESWCILRSNFYSQNLLLYKDQLKGGVLPLPIGSGKFAPVDCDDVGEAVLSIFQDCSKHKHKEYLLTGPEALSGQSMAKTMTQALGGGKDIKFEDITPEKAREILVKAKVPVNEVQGIIEFYDLVKSSTGNLDRVSKDFDSIVGHAPTSLEAFVKKNIDRLKF